MCVMCRRLTLKQANIPGGQPAWATTRHCPVCRKAFDAVADGGPQVYRRHAEHCITQVVDFSVKQAVAATTQKQQASG